MMETSIAEFHTSFYILEIQNIVLNIPHVPILGTSHCDNTKQEAFKCISDFQDLLCHLDYAEQVVASFSHQIKS